MKESADQTEYEDDPRERIASSSPSVFYDAASIISLNSMSGNLIADFDDESEDELANNDTDLQLPTWNKQRKRMSAGDHYIVERKRSSKGGNTRNSRARHDEGISHGNGRSSTRRNNTASNYALDEAVDDLDDLDDESPRPLNRAKTNRRRQFLNPSTESSPSSRAQSQEPPSRRKQPGETRYPKSHSPNFVAPLPVCNECTAVQDLLKEVEKLFPNSTQSDSGDGAEFIEFELSDFSIYLPEKKYHPFELRGLQHLATKNGHSSFLLDGVLTVGNVRRYVEAVPFKVCSIGNYDPRFDEVGTNIWIHSNLNSKSDVYYRLYKPAPEYKRYHDGFTWLANLAKHFVDYCMDCDGPISVHNFRSDFFEWVGKTHEASKAFQEWHEKYGKTDYRQAVAANIHFLFKESIGISENLRQLLIWHELLERDSIPAQSIVEEQTIVTPYVYECFKDAPFGHYLKIIEPNGVSESRQSQQEKSLDLTSHVELNDARMDKNLSKSNLEPVSGGTSKRYIAVEIALRPKEVIEQERRTARTVKVEAIKVGDVLSVTKDGDDSVWKDEVSRWKEADECWYVYVQGIHVSKAGQYSFDAIWLYRPSDTCCAKMKFPFPSELFMSDNCTCTSSRIMEDDVLAIVSVLWHGIPSRSDQQLFIRQTYLENEKFVTLKESHKHCEHLKINNTQQRELSLLPVGTTVLLQSSMKSKYQLEPYEVASYFNEGDKHFAVCRRLLRRNEIDGQGRPNELVYSDLMEKHLASEVTKRCRVRCYSETDAQTGSIPAPYSRDGCGNSFYITTRLVQQENSTKLEPIENDIPTGLNQGFDPLCPPCRPRLRGMDLYCGGGNFGRGLEEGGAIKNEWAVDINRNAIHAYAMNLAGPNDKTKLFYGSVNDMLSQAMRGNPKKSPLIPLPGDVDFISAGSPCQGFSILNAARNNEKGLRNQSLVASVAAYIDFFRPKYGLLENVMTMAKKDKGRDNDALSQLICCIVGMGYQVQLFVVDAWSCGSPQSRSRLFVSFAAPGLVPLEHPELSHSHPKHYGARGLGKLANGQSFGQRQHVKTPFEFVTAGEATKHLPKIGDGFTYQCIEEPDHVLGKNCTAEMRAQIEAIPRKPRGMCFAKAWESGKGVMTPEQRALFYSETKEGKLRENNTSISTAWGRVNPHGLFPTITVTLTAVDSRTGYALHWDEQRYLTTMEARIAQGFPNNEVLPGNPVERWKILGNSVARPVATSLGLAVRGAWEANDPDDGTPSALMNRMSVLESPSDSTIVDADSTLLSNRRIKPTSEALENMVDNTPPESPPPQPQSITRPRAIVNNYLEIRIPARHNLSSKVLQHYEVPDSQEPSDDEMELDQNLTSSLPPQISAPATEQPLYSSSSDGTLSNSLKRSRTETKALPQINNYKVAKVADQSSPSAISQGSGLNMLVSSYLHSKTQSVNHAALTAKLSAIKQSASNVDQSSSKSAHTVANTSVSDDKVISTEASSFGSPAPADRFRSRKTVTPSRRVYKAPARTPQTTSKVQTVISLISDDEDEPVILVTRPTQRPIPPKKSVSIPSAPRPFSSGISRPFKLSKPQRPQSLAGRAPSAPSSSASSTINQNERPIPPVRITEANHKAMAKADLSRMSPEFMAYVEKTAQAPFTPQANRYKPVDNTAMNAYAKTSEYLGLDGARHSRK